MPVAGTKLLWAKNTDADVFVDTAANQHYVLVSGRWFRAPSRARALGVRRRQGPPGGLREDPSDRSGGRGPRLGPGNSRRRRRRRSPTGFPRRRPSSAATRSSRPSTTASPSSRRSRGRASAMHSTRATPVIKVGDAYYACEDGVWFLSASPTGPWEVASTVPGGDLLDPAELTRLLHDLRPHLRLGPRLRLRRLHARATSGTCVDLRRLRRLGDGLGLSPWLGRAGSAARGPTASASACAGARVRVGASGSSSASRPPSRPWWGPLGSSRAAFYPLALVRRAITTSISTTPISITTGRARPSPAAGRSRARERPGRTTTTPRPTEGLPPDQRRLGAP